MEGASRLGRSSEAGEERNWRARRGQSESPSPLSGGSDAGIGGGGSGGFSPLSLSLSDSGGAGGEPGGSRYGDGRWGAHGLGG
ncbi:unnamed protein product, partial [Ectocarpus fasciculatus]